MDDVSALVARQYTDWCYPKPISNIETEIAAGIYEQADPSINPAMLWPKGAPRNSFDILVAGCGTNQAAWLAYTNPKAKVVGIDLSESSLSHEKFLADRHGLKNLRLLRGNILEIDNKIGDFDLVVCTGVLHHLLSPTNGLQALKSVMRPRGVIFCGIYSQVARCAIYDLQKTFRELNLSQSAEDISLVKEMVRAIPPLHPAYSFLQRYTDMQSEAGIVDLLLHAQDIAFDVKGVLSLVNSCGLHFQGWADNAWYFPEATFPSGSIVRKNIDRFSREEQWSIIDGIRGVNSMHTFILCKHGAESDISLLFYDKKWLNIYPARNFHLKVESRPNFGGDNWQLQRGNISFSCTQHQMDLLQLANGRNNIAQIISILHRENPLKAFNADQVSWFYHNLYERGHLFVSEVPISDD